MPELDRRLSIAPMLEWTTRDYRTLARLLSRHTLLYTEMVTTGALIHGDRARHLDFGEHEHPVALQLGGSDPREMADCARMAEDWGYDEVNINVGCPSDRVQSGRFGACLMQEPGTVAACVAAMKAAVAIPVTVKHRIGVDHQDPERALPAFMQPVAEAGCDHFIVHARKAWLAGLSPRENRDVPPLDYPLVHAQAGRFREPGVTLNGGIETLEQAEHALDFVDGVMIGRAAYQRPWLLAAADARLFGDAGARPPSRHAAVRAYADYAERRLAEGARMGALARPLLGLFQAVPGARAWRRHLSEHAHRPGAGPEVILRALENVPESALGDNRR